MAVYQIVPSTSLQENPYDSFSVRDENICRKKCDSYEECTAFVYEHPTSKKDTGNCLLYNNNVYSTVPYSNSTLFVKNGRKSYWILWLFLGMLVALIFLSRCSKRRF
jgi:hypothetical protein